MWSAFSPENELFFFHGAYQHGATQIRRHTTPSSTVSLIFFPFSSTFYPPSFSPVTPGRKRRSVEVSETSTGVGKTPDAKAAFVRPATEPKRRKTANSAVKGVRSSSRVTRGVSQAVDDQEETSNDAFSSPPAVKPPRVKDEDSEDEFKENEKRLVVNCLLFHSF